MDPASAIIGFVTTGIQVVKLAKDTLDDIKDAPKKLQVLRDRVADTQILLQGLENRRLDGLFESKEDVEAVERAGKKAKACIDKISSFTSKVQKMSKDGALGVKKLKWIVEGGTLKDLLGQLGELEDALKTVVNLAILRSQSQEAKFRIQVEETLAILHADFSRSAIAITDIHQRLPAMSPKQPSIGRERPASRPYLTPYDKLSCPSDCACRCHSPLLKPVVPQPVARYIGQVFLPKRVLHAIGASSWECNAQTCRRDRKTGQRLTWVAWWWYMTISISSTTFTVSLHPPRVIPLHAPVWRPLNDHDVDGLQALFAAGECSVYDVGEDGETLFQYAVRKWAQERSEDALKVVLFLKDAGADPDFTVDQKWSVARIVSDASLATLIEHPTATFLHAVRTSTVAVQVCRSILDMDVVDVLDDYLSAPARREAAQMLFGQLSEGGPEVSTADAQDIIRACGWDDMITYAMWNMPEDRTLRLIRSGMEIPRASLSLAADFCQINIVRALLAAGADVNAQDHEGYTALHWACQNMRADVLELLVGSADEAIDWDARTYEGENALDIAKRQQFVVCGSPPEAESIFDILRAHIPDVDEGRGLEDWEDISHAIPGAFPASESS